MCYVCGLDREVEMIAKSACVVTCLLIAAPAEAGGLFGDLSHKLIGADVATPLVGANKNVGSAIGNVGVGGVTSPALSNSRTCVTPQGSCELASPTLNGTTCFCDFNKDQVFGRVQ
jgi:hypothetical protein